MRESYTHAMQQVPDAPEPYTQSRDPEDLMCGEKCDQCSLVVQDNWNCSNGCPGKKIREAFSKSAPHSGCLAAHNAEPLVRDDRSGVQED